MLSRSLCVSATIAILLAAAGCESATTVETPLQSEVSVKRDGPVYDLSQLDVKPMPVKRPTPFYPKRLREAGIVGEVIVQFIIETDGSTSEVQGRVRPDENTPTDPAFITAAEECFKQWKFRPGQIKGQPVRARMEIPLVFSLND